jgi:hypothetical protein
MIGLHGASVNQALHILLDRETRMNLKKINSNMLLERFYLGWDVGAGDFWDSSRRATQAAEKHHGFLVRLEGLVPPDPRLW